MTSFEIVPRGPFSLDASRGFAGGFAAGIGAGETTSDSIVMAFILPRAFTLLRQAVEILLEATPAGMDLPHLRKHILEAPGVQDCHDLHVWTITSGTHALSAHVVVEEGADPDHTLEALSSNIAHHFDITHSTFQLEAKDRRDSGERVHA